MLICVVVGVALCVCCWWGVRCCVVFIVCIIEVEVVVGGACVTCLC